MRLIDYFIVSHPLSIFVLTSYFIADEIYKLKTKYLSKLTKLQIIYPLMMKKKILKN